MAKYPDVTAGQTEACINRMGGWENFLRFIGGEGVIVFKTIAVAAESLLKLVSTIVVQATTGTLVAKEKFVRDTGRKAKVKISYLGDNFTEWFLSGSGKIEDPESVQTLRYHKLRKPSGDGLIITELGGEAKAETTLSEMFSLMEKQKNGESGPLLNNGWWNIFYIKDQNGLLRTVRVRWFGDGWSVLANSVESPDRWGAGRQVFSRNSVLESSEPSAPAA